MDEEKKVISENAGRDKIPNQQELEKELSDYLSKKYGNRVKIISPLLFPKTDETSTDDARKNRDSGGLASFDMLPEDRISVTRRRKPIPPFAALGTLGVACLVYLKTMLILPFKIF